MNHRVILGKGSRSQKRVFLITQRRRLGRFALQNRRRSAHSYRERGGRGELLGRTPAQETVELWVLAFQRVPREARAAG